MFTIYPAIDLRNGQVVRLRKGDPNQQTTYSSDPVAISQKWQEAGAAWLHVVNLDGAFGDEAASRANRSALSQIARATSASVQFGGGLRAMDDVTAAFDAGAARVVLGTVAAENPHFVADALAKFGAEKIVVGLDSRAGMIVTRGWQTQSQITAGELGAMMREMGAIWALYTEVDRDGMMTGSAAEYTAAVAQLTDLKVIASGGIGKLDDIRELLAYEPYGVEGVIVGRALYEGAVDLREALDLARQPHAS